MVVYNACVVSTLMYGSGTWTTSTYARQEKRLNSFHQEASAVSLAYPGKTVCPMLRSSPGPTFQACSPCSDSADCIGGVMSTALEDGCIPKDILCGELASGRRTKGRPQLYYKDVCKRDMKALDINTESWEDLTANRMMWRSTLNQHLKSREEKLVNAEAAKRACRKEHNNSNRPETTHKCDFCDRDCFSRICLYTSDTATVEQTGQRGCTSMIKLDRWRPL